MQIEFHADGQLLSASLREYAESSLRAAFRRFARRVRKVKVYLWDVNGPRGGIDKGVRLVVELVPSGEVLVRQVDASEFASLSRAIARARHAVRENLGRRRDRRRRTAQRDVSHAVATSSAAVF
jgi:hypothetical protein